jgi:hypothetical protein
MFEEPLKESLSLREGSELNSKRTRLRKRQHLCLGLRACKCDVAYDENHGSEQEKQTHADEWKDDSP